MCFYHDYDDYAWIAQVCEVTEEKAVTPIRCSECGYWIKPGENYRLTHLEQYDPSEVEETTNEDGSITYFVDGEEVNGPVETDDTYQCATCCLLLDAIKEVEEAEGCHGEETKPGLKQLYEDVWNGEGFDHYAFEYAKLHPGVYMPWPFDLDDYLEQLTDEFDLSGRGWRTHQKSQPGHYWCDKYGDELAEFDEGGEGG